MKNKLVFHIGVNAGFFSEYNNMLLAYLYCLENSLKFYIYSKDANFGYKKGWRDYFEPFAIESNLSYHHKYNFRSLTEFNYFKSKKLVKKINFWKSISSTDLLTYEIFDEIRSPEFQNKTFHINEFPNTHHLKSIFPELISRTWRYNIQTKNSIENLLCDIKLPSKYIGIHIRSGDKVNEYKYFPITDYIKKIKSLTEIKELFISTDDFKNIEEIKNQFPEYTIYSFSNSEKKGYNQKQFEKLPKTKIKDEMLELFASIEALSKAEYFIGTYSSNIGTFVSSKRNYRNSFAIDFEEWRIW